MKSVSGKHLCKVLESRGWLLLRINGSHHIYGRPGAVERLTVPVHGSQDLKRGLLGHLLKQAGLTEADVQELKPQEPVADEAAGSCGFGSGLQRQVAQIQAQRPPKRREPAAKRYP